MADMARKDQEKRIIEVNRQELINKLIINLDHHKNEYKEALAGYKSQLMEKVERGFIKAREDIELKYTKTVKKVSEMTDEEILVQRDSMTIVDSISIVMQVPRSYAEEYKAAIDMFTWDVRETVELTYAEFTCFVRDQWDWKSGFEAISQIMVNKMYKS